MHGFLGLKGIVPLLIFFGSTLNLTIKTKYEKLTFKMTNICIANYCKNVFAS
jgi:hypothetical protein